VAFYVPYPTQIGGGVGAKTVEAMTDIEASTVAGVANPEVAATAVAPPKMKGIVVATDKQHTSPVDGR